MATDKLTKKQQKAATFRKGKRKAQDEPRDLPEGIGSDEDERPVVVEDAEGEGAERVEGAAAKRRRRKKASMAREGEKKGSRLIVFVGNLPFTATPQAVTDFFGEHCGEAPEVRILSSKAAEKTKGCAFVEFATAAALQKALRLHHHSFASPEAKARKINVELSAGGGGTSEPRKLKLKQANERLAKQRDKRAAKEVKEVAQRKARGEQVVDETAVKKGVRVEKPAQKVRKVTSGANAIALG